jgi:hypothetical protein
MERINIAIATVSLAKSRIIALVSLATASHLLAIGNRYFSTGFAASDEWKEA